MPIFRGIKNRFSEAHFLALDIGSDSVKALVAETEGNRVNVVGFGREKLPLNAMNSGIIIDIASLVKAVDKAIKQAENMCGIQTSKMIIGVSGDIVKGIPFETKFVRRDPNLKIDLSELKDIVQKLQWKAFDVIRSQVSEQTGFNEIDLKLVNASIVDTKIDGYQVTNPIGFQGKEVTLNIFNAFSPLVYFGAIQTISAEVDKELLALQPNSYALSSIFNNIESKFSGVIIDIGSDTTDISILNNGVLVGTKMFGFGGNAFSKRLSRSLNISFYDAENIKLSYSNDKLERQSYRIVREALKDDCAVWISGVILCLEEFKDLTVLPSKILLSGGASHLPEIKEVLDSREWFKNLSFDKKPQVSYLNPKLIENINFDQNIFDDQYNITSLALAKLGLRFMGEEIVSSKVLKKVVRLMQI